MRDVGFDEDVSGCVKTEGFVERNHLCLGVQEERSSTLPLGFEGCLLHDIFAVALFAFDSKETAYNPLTGFFAAEESCVGDDMSFMMQGDMRALIVDVVHIKVMAFLFAIEDNKSCFEDFVEFGGRKLGEVLYLQFKALRELLGDMFSAAFG